MSVKQKRIIFISVACFLLVAIIFFAVSKPSAKQIEAQIATTRKDFQEKNYIAAYNDSRKLLSIRSLSEKERKELMGTAVSSVTLGYRNSALSAEKVSDVYSILFDNANNEKHSLLLRASAYGQMNALFVSTNFSETPFITFLEKYDDGAYMKKYKENKYLDTNVSIIHSALYDFNAAAEKLYPDKYNKSWQVWLVGLAMAEGYTRPDLEEDFKRYIHKSFADTSGDDFVVAPSTYHEYWIKRSLYTVMSRLETKYKKDRLLSLDDLNVRFAELLTDITTDPNKNTSHREIEMVTRIAFAVHFSQNKGAPSVMDALLTPLYSSRFSIDTPSTYKWIKEYGATPGTTKDYLLEELRRMALGDKKLKTFLVGNGWVF